ncbi:MAG: matrixin family metalloprotease [Nocardioides sp.]
MWPFDSLRRRREQEEFERLIAQFDDYEWDHGSAPLPWVPARRRRRVHPAVAGMVLVLALLVPAYLLNQGSAPVADPDGSYAFMMTQPGSGRPVSYDPCRPITWAVNPSGTNPDVVALARSAAEQVSTASGFTLEYVGETSLRPLDLATSGSVAQVVVGFASPDEVPDLAGDVAGVGGSTASGFADSYRYLEGDIALDKDLYATIMTRPGGPAEANAIIMHEWGHVLGLDHVEDVSQLMYADNVGQDRWGSGDLAGFQVLADNPCAR